MKFNLRWQLLLALVGFALVAALLSYQVQVEEFQAAAACTATVPATGGAFVEGVVGAPRNLNPLLSDPFPIERDLVNLIFDGLTRVNEKGELVPALAQSWQVSEDGRTIEFTLRQDVVWHDGEPFTADDVAFSYGLMQQEGFPGPAALSRLWQAVTITQVDDFTITFTLSEPFSPFLEATTRGILPSHLLEGVTAVGLVNLPFNQEPIGTGPFMAAVGQDWPQTNRLKLTPNPLAWPQGTRLDSLDFQFFADETSLLAAFAAGEIDAINQVSAQALPEIASIPGVRLFTAPEPHYTTLFFNLGGETPAFLSQKALREGLAYALDQEALVDTAVNGQGLVMAGPYPSTSWAYNPMLTIPYATNLISATAVLEDNGWTLTAGSDVRQKEETELALTLVGLDTQPNRDMARLIADQWAQIGAAVTLDLQSDLAALRQLLDDGAFDAALVNISPLADPDLYDFWSQEAIIRGQNYGGWNNRRASEALERGRQVWGLDERRPYYDAFLRQFNNDLPAIPIYQHVYTYALSPQVHEAEIGRIDQPRDRYETWADWFLHFEEIPVNCPDTET